MANTIPSFIVFLLTSLLKHTIVGAIAILHKKSFAIFWNFGCLQEQCFKNLKNIQKNELRPSKGIEKSAKK